MSHRRISWDTRAMTSSSALVRSVERIERLCASTLGERDLRIGIVTELRRSVGFDAYVWLLTDPVTAVGSNPVAAVPALAELPTLIKVKYSSRINRWTTLTGAPHPVRLLSRTAGDPLDPWREMLTGYGIVDVASTVCRDRHGTWAFLDLWRDETSTPFTDDEVAVLASTAGTISTAVRRRLAGTFVAPAASVPRDEGPAVLILDDALCITGETVAATAWLQRLLPATPGMAAIPAAAYNVAAQLLAAEAGVDDHPASARTHVPGFTWVTVRASRLAASGTTGPGAIAVSIEETPGAERLEVYARSHAFSPREHRLVRLLARGLDTRELAEAMSISDYTVGDHLKSIFARTGLNSRNAVLTAALGADA
jgi:DNA-binding CsgD family transcriptional regulator